MRRDAKGRYLPGPMDDELRAAISRGQIARHLRDQAQKGPRPGRKRCTQCKRVKRVPEDFSMRKRLLKSGAVTRYPAGECLLCARKRRKRWEAKVGKEAVKRMNQASARRYRDKDVEAWRRRKREQYRAAAERKGVVARGPWKKYRESESEAICYVDPALFLEWFHWEQPQVTETEKRRIREAQGRIKRMDVRIIDAIMTRVGAADQFAIFYPPQEKQAAA